MMMGENGRNDGFLKSIHKLVKIGHSDTEIFCDAPWVYLELKICLFFPMVLNLAQLIYYLMHLFMNPEFHIESKIISRIISFKKIRCFQFINSLCKLWF